MRILYMCVCISTINLGICANCAGHCVAGSLAVSVPMIMCIFRCYLLFIVNSLVFYLVPSCLPLLGWRFQRILIRVRVGNLLTDFAGLVAACAGLGGQHATWTVRHVPQPRNIKKLHPCAENNH